MSSFGEHRKKISQKVPTTITIETNNLSIWPARWRWNLFNWWENEWIIISVAESTDISMSEWKDWQNNYYKTSEKEEKKNPTIETQKETERNQTWRVVRGKQQGF